MAGRDGMQESAASKRRAAAFRKNGGWNKQLEDKAAAAARIQREMNVRDEETGAHPLARGYRALRQVTL